MEVSDQLHIPAALLLTEKHENGWPQSRYGRFGAEKSIALFRFRTSDHPVRTIVTVSPTCSYRDLQKRSKYKKVKQSRYRPGVAQRVPGS